MSTFGDETDVTWITSAGSQVTTTPAGESLRGIFRDAWADVDVGLEVGVRDVQPTLDVRLAHLPEEPRERGRLVVNTLAGPTHFEIVDAQPDGEGMTKLVLHRVDP
ncbi:MAG: hypothetical protein AAF682_19610 [Planctomycetota bacterium]